MPVMTTITNRKTGLIAPPKGRCPKCSTRNESIYATTLCGAYHANNMCPMRSPPERDSGVEVNGVALTCGELMTWRDRYVLPTRVPVRELLPDLRDEATLLRQARYVLRDLHKKHTNCGYAKMSEACERAADRAIAGADDETA